MKFVKFNLTGLALVSALAVAPTVNAASSTAIADITGVSVFTTGTATATFIPFSDLNTASGMTTGGTPDFANDGMFFDSEFSVYGEGTAVNSGLPGLASSSYASAAADAFAPVNDAFAYTFTDFAVEMAGMGTATIEISYELFVDTFANDIDGFAIASVFGTSAYELVSADIAAPGGPGLTDFDAGVLTLFFSVDDFGFGPYEEFVTVGTEASISATAVPVPAAIWLFGTGMVALVGFARRKA